MFQLLLEDKGSEPHGLHIGHFKAAIQSLILAYCDALFRNIPLTTGFVPSNWQNLMNFAIEKKGRRLPAVENAHHPAHEFRGSGK